MANLTPVESFDDVRRIDKSDPVLGYDPALPGAGIGVANLPAEALTNRTEWLKKRIGVQGSWDLSGTPELPGGASEHKTYLVTSAGSWNGVSAQVGDLAMFINGVADIHVIPGTLGITAQLDALNIGWIPQARNTAAPNASVPAHQLKATGAESSIDLVMSPKGNGAIQVQVADNTISGGNKRGQYAVDFQSNRTLITQVASGYGSAIINGSGCLASGTYSIAGGSICSATATASLSIGGTGNAVAGTYAAATGGENNAVSGIGAACVGGKVSSTTASGAAVIGGEDSDATAARAVVIGGYKNLASGWNAVSIGQQTIASGKQSFCSGTQTTASGENSAVLGGSTSSASGSGCVVVGGGANTASGFGYSAVIAGEANTAGIESSVCIAGAYKQTTVKHQISYGPRMSVAGVNNNGSSTSLCAFNGSTTGAASTVLRAGVSGATLAAGLVFVSMRENTLAILRGTIIGKSGANYKVIDYSILALRDGSNAHSIIGSTFTTLFESASLSGASASVAATSLGYELSVTGVAGFNINWASNCFAVEIVNT